MPTRAPQGKGSRRLGRVHPAQAVPRDLVWGVNPWRDVVAFYLRVELKMDKQGSQAEGIFLVLDETFDLDFWVKGTKEENQWQKSHVQARWESGEPQAKSPVLSPLLFPQ
ncbi:uncharacterized protein [Macaca nemestrina]|uniref:uncharacterized protein isoform X8 n=1 Tax=Macaca nemestrina TaxID=9545 RepID=UPI0039B8D544